MSYWEYADYASEINMLEEIIARILGDKPPMTAIFGTVRYP